MSTDSLRPVYLLTGSDRPKRSVALKRLRDRFGPDSVEQLSAHTSSGPDTVASANAARIRYVIFELCHYNIVLR